MPDHTTLTFIEQTLYDLSEEYQIPEIMIPQLIGLLKKFPDSTIRGAKKGMRDGLEQQIEHIKDQGNLS